MKRIFQKTDNGKNIITMHANIQYRADTIMGYNYIISNDKVEISNVPENQDNGIFLINLREGT